MLRGIKSMSTKSFYDFAPIDNKGNPFPFSQLKGKVVLVVNVASKCGFSGQYEELETLYEKYQSQGFVTIAFPCNQFGGQEPGSDREILEFCRSKYNISFPIMKKVDVNGEDSEPVYTWLKDQKAGFLGFKGIKWNFEKFLVDRSGHVVERWTSMATPLSLEEDIEKVL